MTELACLPRPQLAEEDVKQPFASLQLKKMPVEGAAALKHQKNIKWN